MKPIEEIRHERLLWLRERYDRIQDLADAIGKSHSQVSQLLTRAKHSKTGKPRTMGSELAREIEVTLSLPQGVMDTPLAQSVTSESPYDWQAHPESFGNLTVPQKPMSWRELMTMELLPDEFLTALPDDAMAPEMPAGMRIEFSTTESPVFGDHVLIRDARGQLHFRLYAQSASGSWEGYTPKEPAFRIQYPERGAVVVAVMVGHYVARRRQG